MNMVVVTDGIFQVTNSLVLVLSHLHGQKIKLVGK